MSSLSYYKKLFLRIYVQKEALHFPVTRQVLSRLKELPVFYARGKAEIPREHLNQRTLFLTSVQGDNLGFCPGSKGHVCCNYITLDLYVGCTLGCSYCVLKNYLNFAPVIVHVDPKPAINRIKEIAAANPGVMIRVGTGEVGDSLQLDPLFQLSQQFIRSLAAYSQVHFEMKTKTNFVDHLLNIEPKGNAVIGFSLNPQNIIEREEGSAAGLSERLEAAKRAADSGYRISLHFDPVFHYPGWKKDYGELIRMLRELPVQNLAWISLGTFRYLPKLRDKIAGRPYLFEEFVPSQDGKYRYIQRVRKAMYKYLHSQLQLVAKTAVYMCMESEAMWSFVYGDQPQDIPGINSLFLCPRGVGEHSYYPSE